MARYVVNLVLIGAALAADPDACVRSGGDSCIAVDHSLMQVVSRDGRRPTLAAAQKLTKKDKVPLELAQVTPEKPHMIHDENRSIANLTALIEKETEDFEYDLKLLVFGQKKLCNMATHHEARVKVLVKILEVEAGKKTGAHFGSKTTLMETAANKTSLIQKTATAKDPGMHTATKEFSANDYPTEKMVTNQTLDNLTVDVRQDVHWVEAVLEAISAEKDRIEVVGTDSKTRIEELTTLLTSETQQCNAEGFYQPGDAHYHPVVIGEIMAQTKQTGEGTQEDQQAPSMAQTEEAGEAQEDDGGPLALLAEKAARAPVALLAENAARDFAQIKKELQEFPGWNLTLHNITTALLAELTLLEDDLAALVDKKNRVDVAGGLNTEKLENLDAQTNAAMKGGLESMNMLETDKEEQQGNEEEKQQASEEERALAAVRRHKADLAEKTRNEENQPEVYKFPAPPTGPIANLTIANATQGIDQQIFNLEQDMSAISREKREVCLASAKFLERLQTIIKVMNTLEC